MEKEAVCAVLTTAVRAPRTQTVNLDKVASIIYRPATSSGTIFPMKLALSLTINKSQGQSAKWVGLDLRTPVFSHGQLYVAVSRTMQKDHMRILMPPETIDCSVANVVFPEVLIDAEINY